MHKYGSYCDGGDPPSSSPSLADTSIPEKLLSYNRANRAVAILCNHQVQLTCFFTRSLMQCCAHSLPVSVLLQRHLTSR